MDRIIRKFITLTISWYFDWLQQYVRAALFVTQLSPPFALQGLCDVFAIFVLVVGGQIDELLRLQTVGVTLD